MQRKNQLSRTTRLRRYPLLVEYLERREAPSLLVMNPEDWIGAAPAVSGAPPTTAVSQRGVNAPELLADLFNLPAGLTAVAPEVGTSAGQTVAESPSRPATPATDALFAGPFRTDTVATRNVASMQTAPSQNSQAAGMTSGAALMPPPNLTTAAVGNQLFNPTLAAGSTESLWSAMNAGGGDTGPGRGEFTETLFASGVGQITGLAWVPDGVNRLFAITKGGDVRIIENGRLLPTPFATIRPIFTNSECGLIGIAFDPDYLSNGFVYFFVTVSNREQQIIRYTDAGNIGVDKTTIVGGLPTVGNNHDGGAIGFGQDGRLYWAIGDLGNGTGVDGDLSSLASKIGRANRDGSVPGDNPFDDGPGPNNDYIVALGHRNPFTFTFQPGTNLLWVNTVGTSYEQVFIVDAGTHAGWNDFENNQPAGFLTPQIKYRTNGTDTRNITANGAVRQDGIVTFTHNANNLLFRRGEKITVNGVGDASFNGDFFIADTPTATTFSVFQAGPDTISGGGTAVTQSIGGCLTGGEFYNATAFPSEYHGNFFFGDCNTGRVMRATLDANNNVTSVDQIRRPLTNSYIDAAVGPDGALYYGYISGQIFRLSYNQVEQHLIISPQRIIMDENGVSVFNVSLAVAPASDVVVNVAYDQGDTDIVPLTSTTLTFTPDNWSTPQPVYLYAFIDDDADLDFTSFSVNAKGLPTEFVHVTGRDSF